MSTQLNTLERLDVLEADLAIDRSAEKGRFKKLFVIFAILALAVVGFFFMNRGQGGGGAEATVAAASQDPKADSKAKKASKDDKKKDGEKAADGEEADGEEVEDEEEEEDLSIPVSAVAIATGDVNAYITSTANLVPENDVKILAEAEGRVSQLKVEEGDMVRKGQVLASLVHDDQEILVEKAELKLTNARMAFERSQKSAAADLISQETLDKTNIDLKIAEQELEEARWALEKTQIRAPFKGMVTERMVQPGKHVRMGDELFSFADFDPLVARIYLPEKDVLGLETGREVRLVLKADEEVRFEGKIRQVSPIVDTATGTVKVTIEVGAPPSNVRPGAFVSVNIIRETHSGAVLVPREAVIRELQSAYVFVVGEDGEIAEKRSVKLGLEENGHIETLEGLAQGESVVIAGQGALKNGSEIRVLDNEDSEADDFKES